MRNRSLQIPLGLKLMNKFKAPCMSEAPALAPSVATGQLAQNFRLSLFLGKGIKGCPKEDSMVKENLTSRFMTVGLTGCRGWHIHSSKKKLK